MEMVKRWLRFCTLLCSSGKPKINVGDFKFLKEDTISEMSERPLLSIPLASPVFGSHVKFRRSSCSSWDDNAVKKNKNKTRGRLNDMIWLYGSARGKCSRCLAPGKSPCLAKGAEISKVDCTWHYWHLFNAFMYCQTDRGETKEK